MFFYEKINNNCWIFKNTNFRPNLPCLNFVFFISFSGSFRESPRPSGQDPNLWTVEEVMQYIRDIDPVLAPHADLFRKHVCILFTLLSKLPFFHCNYFNPSHRNEYQSCISEVLKVVCVVFSLCCRRLMVKPFCCCAVT